jgi:tRNA dimethylallyltransferase
LLFPRPKAVGNPGVNRLTTFLDSRLGGNDKKITIMNNDKKKIVVILGPTASGKTKLAVELANKFNGEIISADSRQVYRGMDVGTGKDLEEYSLEIPNSNGQSPDNPPTPFIKGAIKQIPYHLIDVANPKRQFDLANYQRLAFAAIDDILASGKLPILVGGSGLYLQAVVDNYKLTNAVKDLTLRKDSEKLEAPELFTRLEKLAPKMAAKLNQSDKNNKRRLIRYLEIFSQDNNFKSQIGKKKYDSLIIGVTHSPETLKKRIAQRLIKRLKEQNLIGEVENLHSQGLSWKKLEDFGLEYKFISLYLQKEISYEEMVEKLNIASYQFAKRQLSWFRRWEKQGAKIKWLKKIEEAIEMVKEFLK